MKDPQDQDYVFGEQSLPGWLRVLFWATMGLFITAAWLEIALLWWRSM